MFSNVPDKPAPLAAFCACIFVLLPCCHSHLVLSLLPCRTRNSQLQSGSQAPEWLLNRLQQNTLFLRHSSSPRMRQPICGSLRLPRGQGIHSCHSSHEHLESLVVLSHVCHNFLPDTATQGVVQLSDHTVMLTVTHSAPENALVSCSQTPWQVTQANNFGHRSQCSQADTLDMC